MHTRFITHVALYCRDLDRAVAWYCDVLGMTVKASAPGRFAAVAFGEKHHDFALVQAPPGFADPSTQRVGLYHIAIDTGSFAASVELYKRAQAANSEFVKAIDHRLGKGIYLRDPDGNILELWSESYPSMAEALAGLETLDPPFHENPIGYPLDIEAVVKTGQPVRKSGEAPQPADH